jgi:multidrug transporter EmrE-like cation transporter
MAGVFVYGESMTALKFIAIMIIASGVALLATC